MICFALLGGTAFFGYWYMNQFSQVFDDLGASYFANTDLAYPSFSRPDTGLASTTPEIAGLATSTETLTATSTDEVVVDEEMVEEPVVFVLIKETRLGYLNARTGPSTTFEKILELEFGNEYELIEEEGNWYHLKIDEDTDAWVISTFAELLQSR